MPIINGINAYAIPLQDAPINATHIASKETMGSAKFDLLPCLISLEVSSFPIRSFSDA